LRIFLKYCGFFFEIELIHAKYIYDLCEISVFQTGFCYDFFSKAQSAYIETKFPMVTSSASPSASSSLAGLFKEVFHMTCRIILTQIEKPKTSSILNTREMMLTSLIPQVLV
jgi:hypothetical protein